MIDVIVEKVINIDQNSRSQTALESVRPYLLSRKMLALNLACWSDEVNSHKNQKRSVSVMLC